MLAVCTVAVQSVVTTCLPLPVSISLSHAQIQTLTHTNLTRPARYPDPGLVIATEVMLSVCTVAVQLVVVTAQAAVAEYVISMVGSLVYPNPFVVIATAVTVPVETVTVPAKETVGEPPPEATCGMTVCQEVLQWR